MATEQSQAVGVGHAPMTDQEALHELGNMVRLFKMFETGESVIMALIEARNKEASLQTTNAGLEVAVEGARKELKKLQAEQETTLKTREAERVTFVEETAKQCESKKAEYQEELGRLKGEVEVARGELEGLKVEMVKARGEENAALASFDAKARDAEFRLKKALDGLAALKANL